MKRITILLAEDHTVVRKGFRGLLALEPDFEILGEVADGRAAVAAVAVLRPDVTIMDIAMPLLNGLEATRQIKAADPTARVLILSAHGDEAYVASAVAVGVDGFLLKQASVDDLKAGIREVAAGNSGIAPRSAKGRKRSRASDRLNARMSSLTPREREVLQLIAEGHANKMTATILGISAKTVEKHREHLMGKLGIHDTAGLTRYAIAAGMIESALQVTIIEPGAG